MTRQGDYILLTQVDNILGISYIKFELSIVIEVNYNNSNIDLNEYIKIPKYVVVMHEEQLDIMILEKVDSIDMELMQLAYISKNFIELNEAGKQYYNILCMTMNNNETDENWCNIDEFIEKYTY